ncbi:hypothetical protein [Streptomyces sp. NPDC127112]|uniref:hypothetical protein n=1 Tax=Streptomyces sp. NPDC127112 TaxID=3345364 RepID=UPI00363371FC
MRHLSGRGCRRGRDHEPAEVQGTGVTAAGLVRARAVGGGVGEALGGGGGVGEAERPAREGVVLQRLAREGLTRHRLAGDGLLARHRVARLREAELPRLGVTGGLGLGVLGLGVFGVALVGGELAGEGGDLRHHLRVAPGTALPVPARHQQEFLVLGRVVDEVLEGVAGRGHRRQRGHLRDRSGNALLIHHARVVRVTLARDLAGVSHAYPSPIGVASSPLRSPGALVARRAGSPRGATSRGRRHDNS